MIRDTPVFNRRVVEFGVGVTFGPYEEDGRTLLPRLLIGAFEYVAVDEIAENLTFISADVDDRFDGTVAVQTSGGEKVFSKFEAEAVNREEAVVKSGLGHIKFLALGTNTPRSLEERFSDAANIKDFGAIGDGIVDDYQALKSAFDSSNSIFHTRWCICLRYEECSFRICILQFKI